MGILVSPSFGQPFPVAARRVDTPNVCAVAFAEATEDNESAMSTNREGVDGLLLEQRNPVPSVAVS